MIWVLGLYIDKRKIYSCTAQKSWRQDYRCSFFNKTIYIFELIQLNLYKKRRKEQWDLKI